MKIVINICYGGFSLSREAYLRLRELGSEIALSEPDIGEAWVCGGGFFRPEWCLGFCQKINREDKLLLQVIQEIGIENVSGPDSQLKIIDIPDGVKYKIHEHAGVESIHEEHRIWE